jgi:hypothetical protein
MASNSFFFMTTPSVPHALRVGGIFVLLYALCLIWPNIYPFSADVLTYHLLSLKLTFPGFQGYAAGSILWGGVLSFIYGFLASMIFHSLHKKSCCGQSCMNK